MLEEKNVNQQNNLSQPIEDVFSKVDQVNTPLSTQSYTPQEGAKGDINISEGSIGQEKIIAPEQKLKSVRESQVSEDTEKKGQGFNTNKLFFYLILALIILLGAFAIWVLVF